MPDNSAAALYPQPNQNQPQGLASNPLALIPALNQLQQYQILQQQAPALGQQPAANLQATQTSIQNARMQMQADVLQRARQAFGTKFGARKDPISETELHSFTADYARQNAVDATTFPDTIPSVAGSLLTNPNSGKTDTAGIPRRARELLSLSVPATTAAAPAAAPPGMGGTPMAQSGAGAIQRGTYAVGQPIGEEIPQKAGAEQAANLQTQAAQYQTLGGYIEQLKQDSKVLGTKGGSTLPLERTWGAIAQRLGLPSTMTSDELAAGDSFDKIMNILSIGPAQTLANAGNTDQARTMMLHANPNSQMTQQSREMLLDMAGGNQDYIQNLAKIWQKARSGKDETGKPLLDENGQPTGGLPANAHNDFIREATTKQLNVKDEKGTPITGATMDPRVFWFNRMSAQNQRKFLSQLTPEAAGQFDTNLHAAYRMGWVKAPKNANQQ